MVKSQGFLWVILHQFEFEKKRRPAFGVNEATQVFFWFSPPKHSPIQALDPLKTQKGVAG